MIVGLLERYSLFNSPIVFRRLKNLIKMQTLLVVACTLAAASASYAPLAYAYYPQHIPVIGPNGVPVDTPEVQHAKAAHYAAHAEASARTGLYPVAHLGHAYGVPAIAHNALPLDTPEVAQAKLQHYHDYAVAAERNGVAVHHLAPAIHAVPQVPADTAEVALAKAQHFAAHAAARGHWRKRRSVYAYPQHLPVIVNGVPVDTPEVQHAKAAHFAAHAEAAGRSGAHYYAGPWAYAAPWSYYGHAAIGPDGHPVETPEVQHAKAAHFAAHAAARHY